MKHLLVFIFFVLFHIGAYAQSGFSARLNIPDDVVQGEWCTFELEIFKPENLRGYTVFKQKFPKGFYVESVDVQGAEFSYRENELQLTWLRIPADAKIIIQYKVSPMYGVTGKFNLSGELSYMIGGNQGIFELKEYELNVLKEKKPVEDNSNTEEEYSINQLQKKIHNDISCKRNINHIQKKNEYIIEVVIKTKHVASCHLVEQIPDNFVFEAISSPGAVVKLQKDKASFMWSNFPKNKEISVKYKLIPEEGKSKQPNLTGKLSILKNGHLIDLPVMN